jgi:hypothetical protein
MSKSLTVDGVEYLVADDDFEGVATGVQAALNDGSVAVVPVQTTGKRAVTLLINGRTATSVVIDPDTDGRPTEFG